MTLQVGDNIEETTTTTGTGPYNLAGAVSNARAISSICGNGDTIPLTLRSGSDFITALWTFNTGSPNTITAATIYESSNANAAVSFGAGVKNVICDLPAKVAAALFKSPIIADAAQSLTATQMAQARANIAVAPIDAIAFSGMQVNGSFNVSQNLGNVGATLTATGTLQTKYIADQIALNYKGSFVVNAAQTSALTIFPGCPTGIGISVTTAQASLGTGDQLSVTLPIEGYRTRLLSFGSANAMPVSLGFWFYANRAGTYSGSFRNATVNRCYPFSFTVAAATPTWVALPNMPGDTSGTWAADNGVGVFVTISLAVGTALVGPAGAWAAAGYVGVTGSTNGVAATSDVFYISNVFFVPGIDLPTAARAAMIQRPFDTELILCKRYWRKSYEYGVAPGTITGYEGGYVAFPPYQYIANTSRYTHLWDPDMRASPTVVLYAGVSGTAGRVDIFTTSGDTGSSTVVISASARGIIGWTAPGMAYNASTSNTGFQYTADARF